MAKHANENYVHNCGAKKIILQNYEKALTEMEFEPEQVIRILNFYLFNAPIIKNDKGNAKFGLKSLKEYGWMGNSKLSRLEGKLLKASEIGIFCFIKADSINETLNSMDLNDKICIDHPRAILKQNIRISVHEDGTTVVAPQETRMECLFRHIRNAFAHNQTYIFDNGNVLLEDSEENEKISARILIPKGSLLKWINITESELDGEAKA